MRIDQSIKDRLDRTLIARGTILDSYMIGSLQKLGVGGIYVSEGREDPLPEAKEPPLPPEIQKTIDKTRCEDPSKIKLSESLKQRVSTGMQYLYEIIKEKENFSQAIALAVLQHHEKMNGRGYPLGVKADKITDFAKILSVVDVYDALVTERPYKKALSQRTAIEMIMSMTEELDIKAMKVFFKTVILYPVDTIVELSNGEKAKVVKNNEGSVLRPTVVGIATGKVYNLADDLSCANILIV